MHRARPRLADHRCNRMICTRESILMVITTAATFLLHHQNKAHERQHKQHHYSFIIIGWAGHQPRPLPQGAQALKRPLPHRLQLNSAWHCVCHRESFSQLMAMPEVCNHCIFQRPSPIFSALQSSQDITKTHKQQQNQNIHHKHIYTQRS